MAQIPQRSTLDGFRIDWHNLQYGTPSHSQRPMTLQVNTSRRLRPQGQRDASHALRRLFTWSYTDKNGKRKDYGAHFRKLFLYYLNLENDDEWQFVRPLGHGGFGAVALFQRVDRHAQIIDVSVQPRRNRID